MKTLFLFLCFIALHIENTAFAFCIAITILITYLLTKINKNEQTTF